MVLKSFAKNLIACGLGLLLVLLVELVLVLAGVEPLSLQDRFVGFDSRSKLFIEETPGHYVLNPARERYFNPQSFTMPKPADSFRIVTLGGSTTYGRPYYDKTSFGAWLAKLVERYGQTRAELINAGGISYASYRVRRLLPELASYQPDLLVVYSGHNEFLEARNFRDLKEEPVWLRHARSWLHRSRLYSILAAQITRLGRNPAARTDLPEEVAATIEEIGGPELYHRDPEFRAGVFRQYRYEIEELVRFCREREIPLILATLPVNLSGLSPFKSEHRNGLQPEEGWLWRSAVSEAEQAFQAGDYAAALKAFQQAEAIDGQYAWLSYRLGQTFEALGRGQDAYAAYDRAREEDVIPLRALNAFNETLRTVAAETGTPLADVENFYRRISPSGIPGNNLFDDHVHPTIEGQQIVAWAILNAATESGLVPLSREEWQSRLSDARLYLRREYEKVPPAYLAYGQWGVGRLYVWAGKYAEAYLPLQRAWQQIKDESEIPRYLGQLELARGRYAEALDYFDEALKLAPEDETLLLNKASALSFSGAPGQCLAILDGREWSQSKLAVVWLTRGQALMLLDQAQQGLDALRKAAEMAPEVASYRKELAKGLADAGFRQEAGKEYRAYLELSRAPDVEGALDAWLEKVLGNE